MESKLKQHIKRFSMRPLSLVEGNGDASINHPYTPTEKHEFDNQYFQASTRRRNTSIEKNTRIGIQNLHKDNERPVSVFLPSSIRTKEYQEISNSKESKQEEMDLDGLPKLNVNTAKAITNHLPSIINNQQLSNQIETNVSTDSLLITADELLLQLLLSQALKQVHPVKILTLESLELLKKEKSMNLSKLTVLEHKLSLEIKVRDGAKNLIKMYSNNNTMLKQAQEQFNASVSKLEQVAKDIFKLYTRIIEITHILDYHNSSVLSVSYQRMNKNFEKIKSSIQLREGQFAVKDDIYKEIESSDETIDFNKHNQKHIDTLLNKLNQSQTQIIKLEKQLNQHINHSKSNTNSKDELNDIEQLNERINQLEIENQNKQEQINQLSQHNNNETIEYQDLIQQHTQLLIILEELYSEIPSFDSNEIAFSIPSFIDKVDGLLNENHDLLDKVLNLQKLINQNKK